MIRRRTLIGGAVAGGAIAATYNADAWIMGLGGTNPAPPPGGLATVAVSNFGGSSMPIGTPVRFAHVFGDTNVTSGRTLSILDGANNPVPFTLARQSTGVGGGLICVDILAKTARSIAASGSDTFTISSAAGPVNNTLPAGKTIPNIVTDITTNFSNIKARLSNLTFSGVTQGSGGWQADSNSGFAGGTTVSTTGYYRCVATGPAAADFVVYYPMKDLVGGAQHPTLWAAFYITAFLNTSTGAVTHLGWRVWVNQGLDNAASKSYRMQISILLNSTIAFGWGGTIGDGRTFNFASSAVAANAVSFPGNKFAPGQLVRFTTTGTLPTGLTTGTDFYVCPTTTSGASTVYVYDATTFANNSLYGNTRPAGVYPPPIGFLALTNSGSGTHTIQGYTEVGQYSMNCLADVDGLWSWHTDNSGTLATAPTLWAAQDKAFYRTTRKIFPIDIGQSLAVSSDPTPSMWSPMVLAGISGAPNAGGAHAEYGAPMNEFACRHLNYTSDRGFAQTLRAATFVHGIWSAFYIFDHSNYRIPALNNIPQHGPYAGLNQIPNCDMFSANGVPPLPSGGGIITTNQTSHWWTFSYGCYITEGGQDILDLIIAQANGMIQHSFKDAGYASLSRNQATSAGTYWTVLQHAGGEPRQNAWQFSQLADGWTVAPSQGIEASYPEKQYFSDMLDDSADFVAFCRSASGFGANYAALGGWHTESTNNGPQNVSNIISPGVPSSNDTATTTAFQQFYLASAWIWAYLRRPTSKMLVPATHMSNYVANWWAANCAHFSNAYNHQVKEAPGWAVGATTNANFVTVSPDHLGIQQQSVDGYFFSEDGSTVFMLSNLSGNGPLYKIQPQNGDRIWFWDSYDLILANGWTLPPTGVSGYTSYYMHNVQTIPAGTSSLMSFTLSTTDPTDTPVTWTGSNAATSTTLSAGITSSQTSIPLSVAVTTPQSDWGFSVVKIDSEYLVVIKATATSTLTAADNSGHGSSLISAGQATARGSYGSSAVSHSIGAPVKVYKQICDALIQVQGRVTGCPAVTSHFGNGGGVPFGYITGWRQSCGVAAMAGLISSAAFANADALFSDYTLVDGGGPLAWAADSSLMLSISPTLVF